MTVLAQPKDHVGERVCVCACVSVCFLSFSWPPFSGCWFLSFFGSIVYGLLLMHDGRGQASQSSVCELVSLPEL